MGLLLPSTVTKCFPRLKAWAGVFVFLSCFGTAKIATADAIYEDYTFSTFVGPGSDGAGWFDGFNTEARFNGPTGMAKDADGNLYIADSKSNTIRKTAPNGLVTTVAGLAGSSGSIDGIGAAARFNNPLGIAVGPDGTIYVTDTSNHTIRKISPSGVVTTLAGSPGVAGAVDGTGSAARFRFPSGVVVDAGNNVYVADSSNHAIRKITPIGVVTTFAGSLGHSGSADKTGTSAGFNSPTGLAIDSSGNIYVADSGNNTIRKITAGAAVDTLAGLAGSIGSADGTNKTARFSNPTEIVVDGNGNVYVADSQNDAIRKITPAGVVTTPAGAAGATGSLDATGTSARFDSPAGLALVGTTLYIADFGNNTIRRMASDLSVTTLAGKAGGEGSVDATGADARFNFPAGVTVGQDGTTYVADFGNQTIRKVATNGAVVTLAGVPGVIGTNDGPGLSAHFNSPAGVAVRNDGTVFVADSFSSAIREITPGGVVKIFAGLQANAGTNDGTGSAARFHVPIGIAVDTNGSVYVGDTDNNAIRKISPDGTVVTFAGTIGPDGHGTNDGLGTAAQFYGPQGVTIDPSGNVFVADNINSTIRQITPAGLVTTYVGTPGLVGSSDGTGSDAGFNAPFGIAADKDGNIYIGDSGNCTIRKISPVGVVTTIGGTAGKAGNLDGTGADALFNTPEGVAVDNEGNIYVADAANHSIRKGSPALPDRPVVDLPNGHVGVTRHFSISNLTTVSWSWSIVRRPAGSTAQLSATDTFNPTFTPDVEDLYVIQFQGRNASGRTTTRRLQIIADDTAPSVTITNPVSGQVSSNGVFTVRGTATDNLGLSNIWVQINDGAWVKATGTKNWSADVTPDSGTNIVRAYAEDLAGNISATNSVDFRYGAPLTVTLHGGGTVTPNLNGQLLEIGKTYSMTAQAGAGCSFINWTGSVTDTNATLTFVMETNLTFIANFTDPIAPTLTITSPQKNSHASNAMFTATGTASDNGQVAAVWYQLNGGSWTMATNTTNWTAGLNLTQSANTLRAYAVDSLDNTSTTNSVSFTWIPSSQMTVLAVGQGTFSPNYNGWFLENGKTYKMTAKAAFNNIFSRWTDGAGNTVSTSPALSFQVQSNATFHANFVLNPFTPLMGPFAGLFYDTNNIGTTNSGYLTVSMTAFGSFSAKMQLASGQKLSFSGNFTTDGVYSNTVSAKGSAPVRVQLQLSSVNAGQISGSVGGAGWTSPLFAVRAIYSPANPAPQHNNKYTLVIPGGSDSTAQPAGNGYGTISVDISGDVTFKGALGDGTKASQKTFINKPGVWPLFIPYKGGGALFGWMTFTNLNDSDLNGTVYWVKPAASSGSYPGGFNFTQGIHAIGSIYSFTNGVPLLNLPAGGASVLQLGNPVQSFTNHFTLGTDNKITSSDGLKVTVTTSTGLFKGTAVSLGDGTSVPITGVLLQKQNGAYGYFLKDGQSGALYLGP